MTTAPGDRDRTGRGRAAGLALVLVAAALVSSAGGCTGGSSEARDASASSLAARDATPSAASERATLARAEDQRRAKDVPETARASHDVGLRREAARALARIADGDSTEGLLRALEDEDRATVAWGAYGLGASCRGKEDASVRALAARAASFGGDATPVDPGRDAIDPRVAIARAIGRCGGAIAEGVLTSWVRRRDVLASAAAYALGDLAGRRGALTEEAMGALLDAASPSAQAPGGPIAPGLDAALYPFGRLERVPDSFAPRVGKAALGSLSPSAGRGVSRWFGVRALARTGAGAVGDLERIALDRSFTPAERAYAAASLRLLGDEGHAAAADALAQISPSKDAVEPTRIAGDDYGVLASLVASLGTDVPRRSEASLYALASLTGPGSPPLSLARRLAELRCGAAAALAKGAYDSDVLKRCDVDNSEAYERARLASLLRRSLVAERRNAWRALTKSNHVKVREAALEAIAEHPELAETARAALAEALAAKKAGIVATAAELIHAHPDRVLVVSDKEKRAALDPSAPPPTPSPARVLDPAIASALAGALGRAWSEDLVETRTALLDAAVAVSLDGARAAVLAACHDRNATMRERAAKALRGLADEASLSRANGGGAAAVPTAGHRAPVDVTACSPPADVGPAALELEHPLERDVRVTFATDAGDLAIVFEPALVPIAATRFVALAKAGFYNGIVVHRVVPGFVAQFGDPDGDGYGGAGTLLRCETSPVPFGPLDVGVALAGRDTGSSQLFVTLARYPHLDGEYARVGRAEGDWWSLAEGDVIRGAKVEE